MTRYLTQQLGQKIEEGHLNRDTRFKEDLSMDSLDMIEFMMFLEEEHSLDLDKGDIRQSKTIGEATDNISKYYEAKAFK